MLTTEPSGIHAQDARALGEGTSNVVIAVIDTVVCTAIRSWAMRVGRRLAAGYDFFSDKDIANDGDGRDAEATDAGASIMAAEKQPSNG